MKILLLAGTSQARDLAKALSDAGHDVTASLAGATRAPLDLGCQTRVGGFGGDAGFHDWLETHCPDLVVDATHPFATRVTERSARICAALEMPYLLLWRPEWTPEAGQIVVRNEAEACRMIPPGSTVFLATGRSTLDLFAGLENCRVYCRQIDPPDRAFPFPQGEYVIGRPPFSLKDEIALFDKLGVDYLVVKNSGAEASRSKLDAAKALGITTLFLARPDPPDVPRVADVEAALRWIAAHADH